MSLIPDSIVVARLWSIWEADATFVATFLESNRVKGATENWPIVDANKVDGNATDGFPRIKVEVLPGRISPPPKTFGAAVNVAVPVVVNVDITIMHRTLILVDQLEIEHIVRRPIIAAGRTLGIVRGNGTSWVVDTELRGTVRRTEKTKATGGTIRTVSRQTLVVNGRPMNTELSAP